MQRTLHEALEMAILLRATLAADLFAGSCPKAVAELMNQPLCCKQDAPAHVKIRPGRNRQQHRFIVLLQRQPAASASARVTWPLLHSIIFEPSIGSVIDTHR